MKHSPLETTHRELGAKLVDFGGWDMPLAYPEGTISEHRACRNSAAIFDVSHLGTLSFKGPAAFDVLQRAFTNDLGRIAPGRAQYTHLLDEESASVLDDIIIWWLAPEEFEVIPNASNTGLVETVLRELANGTDADLLDTTPTRAMLAVQGPDARRVLGHVSEKASSVGRFRISSFEFAGHECIAAGTGYTGEDGVECSIPAAVAEQFWIDVVAEGAIPAGLGARDTLRLEAGFPLHGHELGDGITPLQAGLQWVVGWDKADFLGKDRLVRQKAEGGYKVMRGLATSGRRPPREGSAVLRDGQQVGYVTSGNFSPTLEHGIALAFIDPGIEMGTDLEVDLRGKSIEAKIVELPFYRSN